MTTAEDRARHEAATNPLRWSADLLWIVPKDQRRGLIPLEPKPAQVALEEHLVAQRKAGVPQRGIVLKSRQVGVSTWVQGGLVLATTQLAHVNALTVAHEDDAVKKLYRIGDRMYRNLPAEMRPELRSFKTSEYMHFGDKGEVYSIWPDSIYETSTAGSPESGRAGTYHRVHLSEYAFYPQPQIKLTAVMQAVPDTPDSLVVIESTANGHNHFKQLWDEAVEGVSDYFAFFWPWWMEDDCVLPFATDRERDEFQPGDTDQSPYAEEEPDLIEPGPVNVLNGENVRLSDEQLNWRRWAIANKCGGEIEIFHQEYPAYPEQAFLATGRRVFEPVLVSRVIQSTEQTDPRSGDGGPQRGRIEAGRYKQQAGRHGRVDAPEDPKWKPARLLTPGEDAEWRLWTPFADDAPKVDEDDAFVVAVDVSDGLPESGEGDPAFQAIEVIDHRSKEQVAEYRSRCDPDLLAEHAVLTAMLFNNAWLAIEKTGPGLAVVRKIWLDFHYPFTYFRKKHEQRGEGETDRLGWDTNRATKQLLIAGGQELLREGTHGIRSRRLAAEMQTYIRRSSGKLVPERGRFADLLMAWLIAQQVAVEMPIRKRRKDKIDARPMAPRYAAFR